MRFLMVMIFAVSVWTAYAGEYVTYTEGGMQYEGYYNSAGKGAPLVLIVHDWDGLTDYEVKRAEMLGLLGYSSFALDMYGKGVRPTETVDKKMMTASLYQNRAKMRTLLDAGAAKAAELNGSLDNAVMIGYCFGGAVALEYARSGNPLKAFISFHGGLSTPEGQDYSKTAGEVVIFHGSADKAVSMQDFASLAVQLEERGVTHEMHTYSGAPHAFTVFGSERYHSVADMKSWVRFIEYIDMKLK